MADELGWDQARMERELQEVKLIFTRFTSTIAGNTSVVKAIDKDISSDGTKLAYPSVQ